MSDLEDLHFPVPPIWEVGITAVTNGKIFDPYKVERVHNLWRDQYPTFEIQPLLNTDAIRQVDPTIQPVMQLVMPFQGEQGSRFWFISPQGESVLQLQPDMIARNWRRTAPPPQLPFAYPGYNSIRDDLLNHASRLREFNGNEGVDTPPIQSCELLYDNMIPLTKRDGSQFKLSEALTYVSAAHPVPKTALSISWFEAVDEGAPQNLMVHISPVSLQGVDGAFLRMRFTARHLTSTWDGLTEFIDRAHMRVRERFMQLTTPELQSTWLSDGR